MNKNRTLGALSKLKRRSKPKMGNINHNNTIFDNSQIHFQQRAKR